MAQRWFLIDGPGWVPNEFKAWQAAQERAAELFLALPNDATQAQLDAATAANLEAQRLEDIAQNAFDEYTRKNYGRSDQT